MGQDLALAKFGLRQNRRMAFEGGDWEGLSGTVCRPRSSGSRILLKRGERAFQGGSPDGCQASMNPGQGCTLSLESSLPSLLPNFKAMLLRNLDVTAKDIFLLETIVFYVRELWLSKRLLSSRKHFILLIVQSPWGNILAKDGINPFP